MPAPYTNWKYKGRDPVSNAARTLLSGRPRPSALSPFVFMTDPQRVSDPVSAARHLPAGITIIYRHFGRESCQRIAEELRQVTFQREQQLLIGHDPALAISVGADGVHFRRDEAIRAPMIWRERCPDWIISMAGLKGDQAYSGDLSVLDGLFISSVFYSKSPSAGDPIGAKALTNICQALPVPVFALGGIKARTAPKLSATGAAGLAGIDGLLFKLD